MKIIQCGYNFIENPKWYHTPETSTNYTGENRIVLLLVRSKMRVIQGHTDWIEYDKNTLIITGSGQYVKFAAPAPECFVNDWVDFFADVDFLEKTYGFGTGIIVPNINDDVANELSQIIRVMAQEQAKKDSLSMRMIMANLDVLLIKISRYIASSVKNMQIIDYSHPEYMTFSKIREQILSSKSENDILKLAISVGMSISTFKRRYKAIFGCSIKQDSIIHRIETSKKLLIETNKTLYEISNELGYTTYELFYKQFKQLEGISPKVYREMHIKGFYVD